MNTEKIIQKYVSENKKKITVWELLMKIKLKAQKIGFIFQYPIMYKNTFIICDFYVPKYNLIIEVDGMYHDEILQVQKDIERDKFLRESGYHVLRLFNSEIDTFDTQSIKTLFPKQEPVVKKKIAVKAKYTLAQKAEDKKKLPRKEFNKKYKINK